MCVCKRNSYVLVASGYCEDTDGLAAVHDFAECKNAENTRHIEDSGETVFRNQWGATERGNMGNYTYIPGGCYKHHDMANVAFNHLENPHHLGSKTETPCGGLGSGGGPLCVCRRVSKIGGPWCGVTTTTATLTETTSATTTATTSTTPTSTLTTTRTTTTATRTATTTATSSRTSTPTATATMSPTTTQTTTVFEAGYACGDARPYFVEVHRGFDCQAQADTVQDVLLACNPDHAGTLSCYANVLSDKGRTCTDTAAAINVALREFRGPETTPGEHQARVGCAFGGRLYAISGCNAVAGTLAAMTTAFRLGGFSKCSVTTPTTSPTTTTK